MIEYYIFSVCYSKKSEHIDWVLLGRPVDGKMDKCDLVSRSFVVDLIATESASFWTATFKGKGKGFAKGAEVIVYDDEFITTVADAKEENNLENLPTFSMPEEEMDKHLKDSLEKIFGKAG
ncbi:DUF3892 domain-containing protein [Pseudomonas sp. K1(2024)]|uniref:DUF3892 domain-containing protein n=1 Tax=Pseudomonas boreofloridensis TaxID=3064348 RepID=A0ABV4ZAC6_9PSED|nr:DUF3892 domain-containing protein [Pseudomonas sp. K13]MDO7903397.1 DUF3892 domain-containing protein [Pseudomonas sp. K13]